MLPPAKKAKKGKNVIPDAATMPTPETSQSPPEEDQLAEEGTDYPTDVERTAPFSVQCAVDDAGDIPIFEVDGLAEGAAQRRSRTNSAILDEASLVSAILCPLPVGHATLLSGDDNVPTNFLAFDFSSPIGPSQHPLDHPTLLSTPPVDHPFHLFRAHTSNLSIEEFLRSEGKDLEQYSAGFALAGYDDSDSLLLPSDAVISQFLASDLVRLHCPFSILTSLIAPLS